MCWKHIVSEEVGYKEEGFQEISFLKKLKLKRSANVSPPIVYRFTKKSIEIIG